MNNQIHWTTWAIFGMLVFLILWGLFAKNEGGKIGFGTPKFSFKKPDTAIKADEKTENTEKKQ